MLVAGCWLPLPAAISSVLCVSSMCDIVAIIIIVTMMIAVRSYVAYANFVSFPFFSPSSFGRKSWATSSSCSRRLATDISMHIYLSIYMVYSVHRVVRGICTYVSAPCQAFCLCKMKQKKLQAADGKMSSRRETGVRRRRTKSKNIFCTLQKLRY